MGSILTIGLAGLGVRSASVVWAREGWHGCRFAEPLDDADLHAALIAPPPVATPLPVSPPAASALTEGVPTSPVAGAPASGLRWWWQALIVAAVAAGVWALAAAWL